MALILSAQKRKSEGLQGSDSGMTIMSLSELMSRGPNLNKGRKLSSNASLALRLVSNGDKISLVPSR